MSFKSISISVIASLLFVAPSSLQAQLCSGSLGDPIVNITFGSGTGKGGALDPSTTTYTYSASGRLDEGYYTIANNTTGLRDNAWHSTSDHTGNANGYMMIVNSSFGAGVFYTKTVTDLCPNTTYEFSAWVMNTMNFESQDPNISFNISTTSGNQLGTYTTGDLDVTSSPTWNQYGFYFNTGANTTVVIEIVNNAPGAIPGNDLALDDITFRPCGPIVTAEINDESTAAICEGTTTSVQLNADVSSGYSNPEYQWQENTGSGWQNIAGANAVRSRVEVTAPTLGSEYQYRLIVGEGSTSLNCGVVSNMVSIEAEALPSADFTISNIPCVTQAVQFSDNSTSSADLLYLWDFGDGATGTSESPGHIYSDTGTYYASLIISSVNYCVDTIDAPVEVQVLPIPHAEFTATPLDTSIFVPDVTITDLSTGGISCNIDWADGSESDCSVITHTYQRSGTYNIMQVVTNDLGCTDTAYTAINKQPEYYFFMPNAFSPDGDGNNDIFKPVFIGVYAYTMQIFNRWGEKVFESKNVEDGWDGYYRSELQNPDVYVYLIVFKDEKELRSHQFKGSVTIIR